MSGVINIKGNLPTRLEITADTLFRLDRMDANKQKPYVKTIRAFLKACFTEHKRIKIIQVRIV